MREAVRAVGLFLMVASVVSMLFLDQTAGDCLVLAVAGFGMSRWMIGGGE
jgi:hypothetical protein